MKSNETSSQQLSASDLLLEEKPQQDLKQNKQNKSCRGSFPRWLLAFLLLGGGIALWHFFTPSSVPTAQTNNQVSSPPKPVETIPLTRGQGNRTVRLLGQVEAGAKVTLSPQIEGTVQKILVKEGDRVTPGMIVAILDDRDARISLAQAKARLAQEKSNLARLQRGTRSEIIAQRQAEFRAAQVREKEAQDNLESLIALQPHLIAQRRAELEIAMTRKREAQDNLERIQGLTLEGALSERALVEAKSTADAARAELSRIQAALRAQETQSMKDIAEARTRLDNAKSDRLRLAAVLAEAQAGFTQEEIAAQQGVVSAVQTSVEQAQLAIERTKIKASVSGIVQSRQVNPGDYVQVNDPLLNLVSDRSVDIFLEIPETLSGQVTAGMRVNLFARALPNWQQEKAITAVVPAANTTSRRQLVRVTLNNPPQELLSGMAIQADLIMPLEEDHGFIVPRDALIKRGERWLLFTVNNNQSQQLEVALVADLGQEVMVTNPQLQEGQSIVVKGGDGLKDNTPVKVVNPFVGG